VELIDVGGRKLAYHRAGGGQPLVLLHGAWSDGREWRQQLAGLSDEFDVVAWDAPGCGGSDDPRPKMAIADYADAWRTW
jgi:pimeloyl-ACP methyl ester carboxylesterase